VKPLILKSQIITVILTLLATGLKAIKTRFSDKMKTGLLYRIKETVGNSQRMKL
jgi:hypothetical protein